MQRPVVLGVFAMLGALAVFAPGRASTQQTTPAARPRRRSAPGSSICSAPPSPRCSRRRAMARRSIEIRRALLEAEPQHLEALAAEPDRAERRTSAGPRCCRRCEGRPPARRRRAHRAGAGRHRGSRAEDGAHPRAPRKGPSSTRGRSRARAHVSRQLQPDASPKEPAYGGHASAMGPAPPNMPSPDDAAPVLVTFEEGARLPPEDVSAAARRRTTSSNRRAAASRCSTTTATDCSTSTWSRRRS